MRILRAHGWMREVKDREPLAQEASRSSTRGSCSSTWATTCVPTELSGAMGLVQLPKLEQFVDVRRQNSAWFRRELAQYGDFFDFQEEQPKGHHSWFGFPIRVKPQCRLQGRPSSPRR